MLRPAPRPRGHLWRGRFGPPIDAETIHPGQATKLMVVGDRPVNVAGRIN